MNEEEVLKEFKEANAILNGHFILSSGLHSDTYLQCALALSDAKRADRLCSALSKKVKEELGDTQIDLVASPAMGGVVVGYEMGRQLGVPAIFCERVDGEFAFRRGFELKKGAKILVVEDVVTTGKSSLEAIKCIKENGGDVVAEASLINRNGGNNPLGDIPLISLANLEVKTFDENNIPDELQGVEAVKPGSRWLKS